MAGWYHPCGAWNKTVAEKYHTFTYLSNPTSFVGLYAADGTKNAVLVDGTTRTGVYHPTGAINIFDDSAV